MDIYENVVIGNFLFSLGVAMGRQREVHIVPLSVNLLQQTPCDKAAGDVLIQGAKFMRLLEFKRFRNDSDKEEAKHMHLTRALAAPEHVGLSELSREVHWFIRSQNAEAFDTQIVPYLDFHSTKEKGPAFLDFVNLTVADVANANEDRSELFSRYLQVVADCQGAPDGASGGMIISVNGDDQLTYVVVDDLRHLGMELKQFHDMHYQQQRQIENERQKQLTIERSRTWSGPSR